jgi:cellulose synthase (UDP-forming)
VFSTLNAVLYLTITWVIITRHREEAERPERAGTRAGRFAPRRLVLGGAVGAALVLAVLGGGLRFDAGVAAIVWGAEGVSGSISTPGRFGFGAYKPEEDAGGESAGTRPKLGVYDPDQAFSEDDEVAIEHIFVSWTRDEAALIQQSYEYARARDRWLMVTVEPWADPRRSGERTLIRDVLAGRYDAEIHRVCRDIAALDAPVFVRWGHEMESDTGRYPWAMTTGKNYVRAYRRFADRCRKQSDRLLLVWSPVGNPGLEDYYPGRDYVDFVGVSVFMLPGWERRHHGRMRSFAENFGEKYGRVARFNRPVMIAEFGVAKQTEDRFEWLADALVASRRYRRLRFIVYFNADEEPKAWGGTYGAPEWKIDPARLREQR